MSDMELAGFNKNQQEILRDKTKLSEKIELINRLCSGNPTHSGQASNVNWCEAECTKKGGVLSQIKGRQTKVLEFISQRKNQCHNVREVYTKYFGSVVKYNQAKDILELQPGAEEKIKKMDVPAAPNYTPAPPAVTVK